MEQLFEKYSYSYNKKYGTRIKFSGEIKVYKQSDNSYFIKSNLIVKNKFNKTIYDYWKEFNITKSQNIFFNQYELIDIYNDIHNDFQNNLNIFTRL
jgi:hypothetical protein